MKYLYLSIFLFIFVVGSVFAVSFINISSYGLSTNQDNTNQVAQAYNKNLSQPRLREGNSSPEISAYSVMAVDIDSDTILYQKNSDVRLLPASTTKIVTALVAMDYYNLDDVLVVPDIYIDGQKMNLIAGEEISVRNLIYGILVYSANDAAETLARKYPGGRESFVMAMNLKINDLGLMDTFFENPTGFDGELQYTTASDLVNIAHFAIQNMFFKEVVGTKEITVGSRDGRYVHRLTNINRLVGEVEGVMGIKTGWTQNARENLVTYLERDGKNIIITVLNSQDRFADTKVLIDWIFANYSWEVDELSS